MMNLSHTNLLEEAAILNSTGLSNSRGQLQRETALVVQCVAMYVTQAKLSSFLEGTLHATLQDRGGRNARVVLNSLLHSHPPDLNNYPDDNR